MLRCASPPSIIVSVISAAQVAEGLAHLHSLRVLHRDVKASNIFLNEKGTVVIGDLGLGRSLAGSAAFATTRGIGTPLYASPEQVQEAPYDAKSDIWAFGCLLHELLAGAPPFSAANQARHRVVVILSP